MMLFVFLFKWTCSENKPEKWKNMALERSNITSSADPHPLICKVKKLLQLQVTFSNQQYPILEFYTIQFLDVNQAEICITKILKLICLVCGVAVVLRIDAAIE
jgi:hypothetical protein